MAAGRSSFDALPDELVARVLFEAARRGWRARPTCGDLSPLDPEDDEPEVRPELLVQLRLVCRRFRRVAEQPQLWQRVCLSKTKLGDVDDAVEALGALPEDARAAIRRVTFDRCRLGHDSVVKFSQLFRKQLTSFALLFDQPVDEVPFTAFPAIRNLQLLEELYIGVKDSAAGKELADLAGPLLQPGLACLSSLSLRALELDTLPVTADTLESLAPLAGTLRSLKTSVLCNEDESPSAVIAALQHFAGLERLGVYFFDEEMGDRVWPAASKEALQPLASLVNMKVMDMRCEFSSIDFLKRMTRLEHATLNLSESMEVDLSPLLSVANGLRSLALSFVSPSDEVAQALIPVLRGLTALENLECCLPSAIFQALAGGGLSWTRLDTLTVETSGHKPVPAAFLKRAASDVPSLRTLFVQSPLPIPEQLPAMSCLSGLRRLVLRGKAAAALSKDSRLKEMLQALLMGVKIEC